MSLLLLLFDVSEYENLVTAWSTWSKSCLLLYQFCINLVFPSVQDSLLKKILIVDKGLIPRQLFYSVLSPISGNLVIIPFSILDTILVIIIESWIFPVLDAFSALHTLTSILFLLSRLHSFTSTSFVPALSSSPLI